MTLSRVSRVAAAVVTAGLAPAGAVGVAGPASAATWTEVPTPNATAAGNRFTAVDAAGASTAWAVGYAEGGGTPATRPIVARWNGTAWSLATTPAASGDAMLLGVDADSASNAWAVGAVGAGTLAQRWNGTAWTVVPGPAPAGASAAVLRGVKSFGAGDAWAVGDAVVPGASPRHRTLIGRWTGTAWTTVPSPSPNPDQNFLVAVDGATPDDVWAIGNIGTDGYGGGTVAGLVLRWNGTAWNRVTLPGTWPFSIVEFHDIVTVAANDVWIVGTGFNLNVFAQVPYLLHWNGQTWQQGTIPNPPAGRFRAVTAVSATAVYAVGEVSGGQTLAARYNGTVWSRETTPSPGWLNSLAGATASGSTVLAVGTRYDTNYNSRTLGINGA